MRITELEKALRDVMEMYPENPALALAAADGPQADTLPSSLVPALRSLNYKQMPMGDGQTASDDSPWA